MRGVFPVGVNVSVVGDIIYLGQNIKCKTGKVVGRASSVSVIVLLDEPFLVDDERYLAITINESYLTAVPGSNRNCFGEELRLLREKAGISVEKAAKIFDMPEEFIRTIEKDSFWTPRETLRKMMRLYILGLQ